MLDDAMAGRPPSKPAPPFGQKLVALRKERALTQPQLADILSVSLEMVDYYERRAKNPSADTIQKVADALHVDPAYFLDGKKRVKRKPGPASALEERIERLRKLPRSKQEVVLSMLDGLLASAR